MKRTFTLLLMCLLLIPQTTVLAESSVPLQFRADEEIYAIYACYSVKGKDVAAISVSFADEVKSNAYANFVDGELWIAVASIEAIDLSEVIGWATAKNDKGESVTVTLTLESLQLNGEGVPCKPALQAAEVELTGERLYVHAEASAYSGGTYRLFAVAYSASGQMLGAAVQSVALTERVESFDMELKNCANAARVKLFLMTEGYIPILQKNVDIGSAR